MVTIFKKVLHIFVIREYDKLTKKKRVNQDFILRKPLENIQGGKRPVHKKSELVTF